MHNIYRHHASSHRLAPESVDKAVQVGGGLQLGGHIGHPLPLNELRSINHHLIVFRLLTLVWPLLPPPCAGNMGFRDLNIKNIMLFMMFSVTKVCLDIHKEWQNDLWLALSGKGLNNTMCYPSKTVAQNFNCVKYCKDLYFEFITTNSSVTVCI